jgi:hypothetical protein
LHLCSNLRQWILSGVRDREAKFAARGEVPGSELAARLEAAVAEALAVVRNTTTERLTERVSIQGYDVTV